MVIVAGMFYVLTGLLALVWGRKNYKNGRRSDKRKGSSFAGYVVLFSGIHLIGFLLAIGIALSIGIEDPSRPSHTPEGVIFLIIILALLPIITSIVLKLTYHLFYGQKLLLLPPEDYYEGTAFYTFSGRVGRMVYFWGRVGFIIGFFLAWCFMVITYVNNANNFMKSNAGAVFCVGITVCMVYLLCILNAMLIVKRLHDLNKPRRDYFKLLIPLYNIYLGLQLTFVKGSIGDNLYGKDTVTSTDNLENLYQSFAGIDIRRFEYSVSYTYKDEALARQDADKINVAIHDKNYDIYLHMRKLKNNDQTLVIYSMKDYNLWDSFVTDLGDGNYQRGRQVIRSQEEKDFIGLNGLQKLTIISDPLS